jgi:hypothetical protein
MPLATTPQWFVPTISIQPETQIVILDDDESIHQVWDQRFSSLDLPNRKIQVVHFLDPSEFKNWLHTNRSPSSQLFLMDYELIGYAETGLDMIERLNLDRESILVTSHFEDMGIQARCAHHAVKILPKGLATAVPVVVL